MRNIFTYETRKSKKDYFKTHFEMNKNDTTLTWKGNRQPLTLKYKSKSQPIVTTAKSNDFVNPKNFANAFIIFLQMQALGPLIIANRNQW